MLPSVKHLLYFLTMTFTDIDECLEEGVCPGEHAVCLNEPGTFACVCAQGYVKEGDVCVGE